MLKNSFIFAIVIAIFACESEPIKAQNEKDTKGAAIQTIQPVKFDYEASLAYPFGRLNPKAPPETKQFSFMIGEFDCEDLIYSPQNKSWFKMKTSRKAEYILNGNVIQDKNWTPLWTTSNMRAFDPKTNQWHVTYFKTPYSSAVWKGGLEGKDIVLSQDRGKSISQLSFFNIGKNEYSWKAENVVDGKATKSWEFTCKRRR